ncbi:ATPase [Rhodobacteraceae bacterium 9Alg 56]|uniref:ATPase n=1 Tax=Algicella marina TaxID=2683284 RepID=A0A6P1T6I4_9RHOB|nr:ATPase [Algicella marina]
MLYPDQNSWREATNRRVALFGMSGLGKTHLSNLLRDSGEWFHYSVDFRIGTRYMGEHIVDNFKREAMRNPFLRELLMSDSIYIASNITFENLSPLSTYLGKPGAPDRGGIGIEEYQHRQSLHRIAEVSATEDVAVFAAKAQDIYGYPHFVADCSGSLCEVVDADNPADPVMSTLAATTLPVWIEGTEAHVEELVRRFDKAPKPMYYSPAFLGRIWRTYLEKTGTSPESVDPDDFIRWGFRQLVEHRLPIYRKMAEVWGITVAADEVAAVKNAHDFVELVADRLPKA